MYVYSGKKPAAAPRWTRSSNSAKVPSRGGSPLRGIVSNTLLRVEARPVSRPCQYGELAESARNSGTQLRSPVATATAVSGAGMPTWTCRPKIATRSATQRSLSTTPWYRGESVISWCSHRENGCVPAEAISAPCSAAAARRRERMPRTSSIASPTFAATPVAVSSTEVISSGRTRSSPAAAAISSKRGTSS